MLGAMETIKAEDLRRILAGGRATVINVLESKDFQDKRIPSSINVPVSSPDFARRVEDQMPSKQNAVVVYCAGARCPASENAARALESAGFRRVMDFAGGLEDWEAQGLPLEGRHVGSRG